DPADALPRPRHSASKTRRQLLSQPRLLPSRLQHEKEAAPSRRASPLALSRTPHKPRRTLQPPPRFALPQSRKTQAATLTSARHMKQRVTGKQRARAHISGENSLFLHQSTLSGE